MSSAMKKIVALFALGSIGIMQQKANAQYMDIKQGANHRTIADPNPQDKVSAEYKQLSSQEKSAIESISVYRNPNTGDQILKVERYSARHILQEDYYYQPKGISSEGSPAFKVPVSSSYSNNKMAIIDLSNGHKIIDDQHSLHVAKAKDPRLEGKGLEELVDGYRKNAGVDHFEFAGLDRNQINNLYQENPDQTNISYILKNNEKTLVITEKEGSEHGYKLELYQLSNNQIIPLGELKNVNRYNDGGTTTGDYVTDGVKNKFFAPPSFSSDKTATLGGEVFNIVNDPATKAAFTGIFMQAGKVTNKGLLKTIVQP